MIKSLLRIDTRNYADKIAIINSFLIMKLSRFVIILILVATLTILIVMVDAKHVKITIKI